MRFGLVKGRSAISGPIQWFTRSVYSHANIVFSDGTVYEAESSGFVRVESLAVNNRGCMVDLLGYRDGLSDSEVLVARDLCDSLVGEDYDYAALLGFLTRMNWEPPASRRKLFCSEACYLVGFALGPSRALLDRIQPWEVSPRDLNISPLLRWTETVVPQ